MFHLRFSMLVLVLLLQRRSRNASTASTAQDRCSKTRARCTAHAIRTRRSNCSSPGSFFAFLRFAQHSRVDRWWRFYDESNFVQQRDQEGFMLQSETPLVSVLNQLLVFVQRHASVCTLGSRRGCASRRASRSMRSRC